MNIEKFVSCLSNSELTRLRLILLARKDLTVNDLIHDHKNVSVRLRGIIGRSGIEDNTLLIDVDISELRKQYNFGKKSEEEFIKYRGY